MSNNKVSKNFAYSMIYQLLLIILPIVTTPYVSRVLGVDRIGLYSYSYTIAALFVLFANLGIANYGTRSIAKVKRNPEILNQTFSSIYAVQLLTSGVIISTYIIYLLIYSEDMLATFLAGSYVISTLFDLNWVLNGLEEFRFSTIRSSFVKIASVVLIFTTVKEPDDIYIYIYIYIVWEFSCK